ncbi:LON peptidase N-terminal domain and RING finger protein 2-like [Amblyraja radiata]|uniref:LON peptidase N-terminal domain and RING finger protein 2-like n=1 Tax=Amblyraja radiata TaxID=386614 RepID=UPI0014025D63|nr:LON peptidase N-terminal domain and RING finger protein 2-like [Amblyraja radiata]
MERGPGPVMERGPGPMAEMLRCPCCRRPLREPVTTACGQTLCRRCVPGWGCPLCGMSLPTTAAAGRVNVLISGLLERWRAAGPGAAPGSQDTPQTPDTGHPANTGHRADNGNCGHSTQSPVSLNPEMSDVEPRYPEARGTQLQQSTAAWEQVPGGRSGIETGLREAGRLELACGSTASEPEVWWVEPEGCLQTAPTQDPRGGHRPAGHQAVKAPGGPAGGRSEPGEDGAGPESFTPDPAPPQLSATDFDCSLCFRLLFEPITTPCGHSFCRQCMERCLDYRPSCPLCKQDLREFLEQRPFHVTHLLQSIIAASFSIESAARRRLNLLEMSELSGLTTSVPIFVCTLAFPGIACPLHVFEPHYRLMMRRCQQTGTRSFGMCQVQADTGFSDYGCMLTIRGSEDLPDGRSLIDAVGGRRFKVLRRCQRDGYNTADIEYLQDQQIATEDLSILQVFHDQVYQMALSWFRHLPQSYQQYLHSQHGAIPGPDHSLQDQLDGPHWCWWVMAVVPIQPELQTMMLSTTSLHRRLLYLQRILQYLGLNQVQ